MKVVLLVYVMWHLPAIQALRCWSCENEPTNSACQQRGNLKECLPNQEACQNEVRRGRDGIRITKRCKQSHACDNNFDQNIRAAWNPSQCNSKVPSSVCKCCCSLSGCNAPALECLEEKEEETFMIAQAQNPELECLVVPPSQFVRRKCSPRVTNRDPTAPLGTACTFSCIPGYRLEGKDVIECVYSNNESNTGAAFDHLPPSCLIKTCLSLPDPQNGFKVCSDGKYLGSRCEFGCDEYHSRVGALLSTCVEDNGDVRWDNSPPTCQPNRCNEQNIRHGEVTCDNPDLDATTTCSFQCTDPGYSLYPPDVSQNTCLNSTLWNVEAPCCTRKCPSNKIDFVVMLDSSSSVGEENWKIMKRFVRAILETFDLGEDKANLGVFRYNEVVDSATQILLNNFTENIDQLLEAFDRIPYDGSGTRTGLALAHARDVLFAPENGNRPDALDLLLVITDGRSQDDVARISNLLRRDGVIIYVLGIIPPEGELDFPQLREIAGSLDNLIIATGGFQDLNTIFSGTVNDRICGEPCAD